MAIVGDSPLYSRLNISAPISSSLFVVSRGDISCLSLLGGACDNCGKIQDQLGIRKGIDCGGEAYAALSISPEYDVSLHSALYSFLLDPSCTRF